MKSKTRPAAEKISNPALKDFPWLIYPFFMVHMLMFGWSGFEMAYGDDSPNIIFLMVHGGFAIFIYVQFYLAIFGKDEVKWMFINAGLGILALYSQLDWMLQVFYDAEAQSYPFYLHIIPLTYFVLYTFLLRQFLLEVSGAKSDNARRALVDRFYIVVSLGIYLSTLVLTK